MGIAWFRIKPGQLDTGAGNIYTEPHKMFSLRDFRL